MKFKIKPSEKIRRRYILIESKRKKDIESCVLDYIGILGWGKAKPVFVSADWVGKNEYVLAVERKSLKDIRGSFELCDKDIKVKRVSGTLKALEKKRDK